MNKRLEFGHLGADRLPDVAHLLGRQLPRQHHASVPQLGRPLGWLNGYVGWLNGYVEMEFKLGMRSG
jgi:hypothetical protein